MFYYNPLGNIVTLGRALTNDVVLPDARVSRGHARLECAPAGCFIEDLGSANGTRVNGAGVQKIRLAPEDLGYERGVDLLEFAYDWRGDVRLAARQLTEAIDR